MEKNYIKIGSDKLLNLSSCNSIGVNKVKQRIVFNLVHSIEVNDKTTKSNITVADYKYWDFENPIDFNHNLEKLIVDISASDEFIFSSDKRHYYINAKNVSYITTDTSHNRIIFNFSTSITKKNTGMLTNDYIFWTFDTEEEYLKNLQKIEEDLINE